MTEMQMTGIENKGLTLADEKRCRQLIKDGKLSRVRWTCVHMQHIWTKRAGLIISLRVGERAWSPVLERPRQK